MPHSVKSKFFLAYIFKQVQWGFQSTEFALFISLNLLQTISVIDKAKLSANFKML